MKSDFEAYVQLLCNLQLDHLDKLDNLTAHNIVFIDPFNKTTSRAHLKAIFVHMYQKLQDVQFVVSQSVHSENTCFITWRFSAYSKFTGRFSFEGCSELKTDPQGLIIFHRDYWDASELMENFPLLGKLLSSIKRKMRTELT